MILTDASGLPHRRSRGAAALDRRGLAVPGDEARHEGSRGPRSAGPPRSSSRCRPDAGPAPCSPATTPELAPGGEERVVPPAASVPRARRGPAATPRGTATARPSPPRGGGEGDVAESKRPWRPRPRATAAPVRRSSARPRDGVRTHAAAHPGGAKGRRRGGARGRAARGARGHTSRAPRSRPPPVVGARRDLRHPRRRVGGGGGVNLDGRPAAVPELSGGREPPGEQRAVGRERGTVRHAVSNAEVRESGGAASETAADGNVVAPCPSWPWNPRPNVYSARPHG